MQQIRLKVLLTQEPATVVARAAIRIQEPGSACCLGADVDQQSC